MDNNPYSEQFSWFPASEQHSYDPASGQVYYHYPRNSQQGKIDAAMDVNSIYEEALPPPARMPKEQAVSLANRLKQLSLVGSIALFGVFSGLIATHLHNSTGQATSFPSPPHELQNGAPPQSDDHADPNAQSGGFFRHHHRDGYGFGNGGDDDNGNSGGNSSGNINGGSFQQPSTSTHVSGR
jgi:hypothetical protein